MLDDITYEYSEELEFGNGTLQSPNDILSDDYIFELTYIPSGGSSEIIIISNN